MYYISFQVSKIRNCSISLQSLKNPAVIWQHLPLFWRYFKNPLQTIWMGKCSHDNRRFTPFFKLLLKLLEMIMLVFLLLVFFIQHKKNITHFCMKVLNDINYHQSTNRCDNKCNSWFTSFKQRSVIFTYHRELRKQNSYIYRIFL